MKHLILAISLLISVSCGDYLKYTPSVSGGGQTTDSKLAWLQISTDLNIALESIDPDYNNDHSSLLSSTDLSDYETILAWYQAIADRDDSEAMNLTTSLPDLNGVDTLSRALFFSGFAKVIELGAGESINDYSFMFDLILATNFPVVSGSSIGVIEEISRLMLWKSFFRALQGPAPDYSRLFQQFAELVHSGKLSFFLSRPGNENSLLLLNTRLYVGAEMIRASVSGLSPLGNSQRDAELYNALFGDISIGPIDQTTLPSYGDLVSARDAVNSPTAIAIHNWLTTGGQLIPNGSSSYDHLPIN